MESQQSGFAHAFLIIGLVVTLVGALGFVFWQNFIYKEAAAPNVKAVVSKEQDDTKKSLPVDEVAATKSGIGESMKNDKFSGLEKYMSDPVDGAISHSDGVFTDIAPSKMVEQVFSYISPSDDSYSYEWTFSDFKDVKNEEIKKEAEGATFFDFSNSYIAVGSSSDTKHSDVFAAYKINSDGKITYVFYGLILGY